MKISKADAIFLRSILDKQNSSEKHIGYHLIPEALDSLLDNPEQRNRHRFYENERLDFILNRVGFAQKTVTDIGCNTGYLLFSLLQRGAAKAIGYEGKPSCANFLRQAIDCLDLNSDFSFHDRYFDFSIDDYSSDITLLLNVLHHTGDDYGNRESSLETAKTEMIEQLNSLSTKTRTLVLQLGFNWKGNINKCLFPHGTKAEMIEFISSGSKDFWDISSIGIAQREENRIVYQEPNTTNILRNDSLGEFLNRPIFILKSKGFAS